MQRDNDDTNEKLDEEEVTFKHIKEQDVHTTTAALDRNRVVPVQDENIPLIAESYRIDNTSIVNDLPIKNIEYAVAHRIIEPSNKEVIGIVSITHNEPSIEFYIQLILALSTIPSLIAIATMTTAITIITSLLPTRNDNTATAARGFCILKSPKIPL